MVDSHALGESGLKETLIAVIQDGTNGKTLLLNKETYSLSKLKNKPEKYLTASMVKIKALFLKILSSQPQKCIFASVQLDQVSDSL